MKSDESRVPSNRSTRRDSLFLSATLTIEGLPAPVTVRVRNLSNGGMMVDGNAQFQTGQIVKAEMRGIGTVMGLIAWTESGRAGVAFELPVNPKLARYIPTPESMVLLDLPKMNPARPALRSRR